MKKFLLFILLVAFWGTVSAGAQERWMVDQVGSVGLHTKAPSYSAGVEVSGFLINTGVFHLGPGAGFLFSRPYFFKETEPELLPMKGYQRALTLPLFVRGELDLGSDPARCFILLDVGYQVSLSEKMNTQLAKNYARHLDILGNHAINSLGWFITPQFGVNFGRHFYAAAGVWCQWARSHEVTIDGLTYEDQTGLYHPTISATLRLGVRF